MRIAGILAWTAAEVLNDTTDILGKSTRPAESPEKISVPPRFADTARSALRSAPRSFDAWRKTLRRVGDPYSRKAFSEVRCPRLSYTEGEVPLQIRIRSSMMAVKQEVVVEEDERLPADCRIASARYGSDIP